MKVLIFDIVARKAAGWTYNYETNKIRVKFRKWFADKRAREEKAATERKAHNLKVLRQYGLLPWR
jgi:hypothetical protein